MKIKYNIYDLDTIEKMHIDANVNYSMLDMLLEAKRSIARLENSRILNSRLLPTNMQNLIETMRMEKKNILQDINKMYYLQVKHPLEGLTTLELYITPDYFMLGEVLHQQFGRMGKRLIRTIDQQTIINKLEEDLKQVYQKKFDGEIIEDDGKKLRVAD